LRWDGATWSQVPVPNTDFDTSTLGVALIDRDTAWVVGGALQAPCGGALALRWDGTTFHLTPTPGRCSGLSGGTPAFDLVVVDGVAAGAVWAVGVRSGGASSATTYVIHWDGTAWTHVPAPAPGLARGLFDVHARERDDVWAVGRYQEIVGSKVEYFAFALHWNGASWTLHDGASAPIGGRAVHAFAADDVYTAGDRIHHFDGSTWKVADDLGQLTGEAMGVTVVGLDAAAPCHLWAAGWQSRAGQLVPFTARQAGTEHWWFGERQCAAHRGPRDALELVGPPR